MMLVNIDEEGSLVAMRHRPTTIIILLKVCSNSPLLNFHIAKSTHSTNSLKLCRYKKPGCVLVAANTAAQIITFTVADLGGVGVGGAEPPPPQLWNFKKLLQIGSCNVVFFLPKNA